MATLFAIGVALGLWLGKMTPEEIAAWEAEQRAAEAEREAESAALERRREELRLERERILRKIAETDKSIAKRKTQLERKQRRIDELRAR